MNTLLKGNLISTKDASALSGYNADYLSRLCRAGKIRGEQIGRAWLVERSSLEVFMAAQVVRKIELSENLAREREEEYRKVNQVARGMSARMQDKTDVTVNSVMSVLSKMRMPHAYPAFNGRAASFALTALVIGGSTLVAGSGIVESAANTFAHFAFETRTLAIDSLDRASEHASDRRDFLASRAMQEVRAHDLLLASANDARIEMLPFEVSAQLEGVATPRPVAAIALPEETPLVEEGVRNVAEVSTVVSNAEADPAGTLTRSYLETGAYLLRFVEMPLAMHLDVTYAVSDAVLSFGAGARDASILARGAYEDGVYAYVRNVELVPRAMLSFVYGVGDRVADSVSGSVQRAPDGYDAGVATFVALSQETGERIAHDSSAFGNGSRNVVAAILEVQDRSIARAVGSGRVALGESLDVIGPIPSSVSYVLDGSVAQLTAAAVNAQALAASPVAVINPTDSIEGFIHDVVAFFSDVATGIAGFFGNPESGLAVIPSVDPEGTTSTQTVVQDEGDTVIYEGPVTIVNNYNEYPVLTYSGVSKSYIDTQIALLNDRLVRSIDNSRRSSNGGSGSGGVLSIDGLSGTGLTLNSSTWNGGSIIGATLDVLDTVINGDLSASGPIESSAYIAGPYVLATSTTATSAFSGNIAVGRNASFGTTAADLLTVNSTIGSNLTPSADAMFDIGSIGSAWRTGYFDAVITDALNVPATGLTLAGIANGCAEIVAGKITSTGTNCGIGSGGITSLNGLTASNQNFATSSDTNLLLSVVSSGSTHTFTTSWAGTLASGRGGTGIGSVAANQLLIGNPSGTGWIQVATSSLGLDTTYFKHGGNAFGTAAILGTTDAQGLALVTGSTTRITILANGNVGIGTTSPSSTLHVSSENTSPLVVERSTPGNTNSNILFKNQVNSVYAGLFPTGGFAVGTNSDLAISPQFVISSLGNVGIGTTTPQSKLSIDGGADVSVVSLNTTAVNADYVRMHVSSTGAPRWSLGKIGTNLLQLSADSTARFFNFASFGGVGIGDAAPGTKLSVIGNAAIGYSSGQTGPTNGLIVNGNVGIGTTSPGVALDVVGTANITGSFQIGSNFVITSTRRFLASSGSAGTPSYGFAADSDTGMYYSANNTLTFMANGGDKFSVTNNDFRSEITGGARILTVASTGIAPNIIPNQSDLTTGFGASAAGNLSLITGGATRLEVTNAGNVGIGTTTPAYALDVSSSGVNLARLSGTNSLYNILDLTAYGTGGAVQNMIRFNSGSTSNWSFGADQSNGNALTFSSASLLTSAPRMVLTTAGSLGLGTTSPSSRLTVAGSGNIELVGGQILLRTGAQSGTAALGASGNGLYVQASGSGIIPTVDNASSLGILSQRWANVIIGTGNSSFAGNVSIGTTTQGSLLNLVGGANNAETGFSLRESTGQGIIQAGSSIFLDIDDDSSSSATAALNIRADSGTTNLLTIIETGNVGIGTAAPNEQLEIASVGGGRFSLTDGGGGGRRALLVQGPTASQTYARILAYNYGGSIGMNLVLNDLGGNVGIGTTTPAVPLDVVGAIRSNASGGTAYALIGSSGNGLAGRVILGRRSDGSATSAFYGTTVDGAGDAASIHYSGGAQSAIELSSGYISFRTNTIGTERMRIDSSGNLGIGTSTPATRLSVYNASSTIAAAFRGSSTGAVALGSNNGAGFIQGYTNDALVSGASLTLQPFAGNVGIGTTTPAAALHVVSTTEQLRLGYDGGSYSNFTVGPSGSLAINTTGSSISFQTAGGTRFLLNSANNFVSGITGGAAMLRVATSGTSPAFAPNNTDLTTGLGSNATGVLSLITSGTEKMTVTSAGNVGIGTTSPSSKFSVETALTTGNGTYLYNNDSNASTNSSVLTLDTNNNGQYLLKILRAGAFRGGISNANNVFNLIAGGNDMTFNTGGDGTTSMFTERMRITNAGNVGIGTTTPSALLSVAGNGYFTGSVGIGVASPTSVLDIRAASALVKITSNTASAAGIAIASGGTSAAYVQMANKYVYSTSGIPTSLFIGNDTTPANAQFTINNAGNVGIGTTSPGFLLDVNGLASVGGLNITSNALPTNGLYIPSANVLGFTTNGILRAQFSSGGSFQSSQSTGYQLVNSGASSTTPTLVPRRSDTTTGIGSSVAGNLSFITSGTSRLEIDSVGNVGIGTTTPDTKLQVLSTNLFTGGTKATATFANSSNLSVFTTDTQGMDVGATLGLGGMADSASTKPSPFALLKGGHESATQGYNGYLGFYTSSGSILTANTLTEQARITSSGNFGIGTSSPAARLSVRGATNSTGLTFEAMNSSSIPLLTIVDGGNVGIGTTTPTALLHTTGSVRFSNFGAGSLQTDADGNLSVSSDERLKQVSGSFSRGLADLMGINPINFHWKASTGFDTVNSYTGFSAQNVQDAIPEAVDTDPRGYLTLSDRPILAASVNAIKELNLRTLSLAPAETNTAAKNLEVSADASIAGALLVSGSGSFAQGLQATDVKAARVIVSKTDELPSEVLTGGDADLYKMAKRGMTDGAEALRRTDLVMERLATIDERLAELEAAAAAPAGMPAIEGLSEIISRFSIRDGILSAVAMVAERFTVGSPERPTGVTFYDEVTGEPYCLAIRNGAQVIREGECGVVDRTVPETPVASEEPAPSEPVSTSTQVSPDAETSPPVPGEPPAPVAEDPAPTPDPVATPEPAPVAEPAV